MKFIEILTKLIEIDTLLQAVPDEKKPSVDILKKEKELLDAIATSKNLEEKEVKEALDLTHQIVHLPSSLALEVALLPYAKLAYLFEKKWYPRRTC